jgi:hypothetical protein
MSKDDRFFPATFQAHVARERLGKAVDEIPGGHLVALSRPQELVDLLLAYASGRRSPGRQRRSVASRKKHGDGR